MDYEAHSYSREPEQICDREEVVENLVESCDSQVAVTDFDVLLINGVAKEKCLYKFSHPQYGKRNPTAKAWDDACTAMNKKIELPEDSQLTVAYMKERWRQLRKQYSSEKTRRKSVGADLNKGFKHYNIMTFLDDESNAKPKARTCNKKFSIQPVLTESKKPRLQTGNSSCGSDIQNSADLENAELESVFEKSFENVSTDENNKKVMSKNGSCDTREEIVNNRKESEVTKKSDLTRKDIKEIQEANMIAEKKKLKEQLLEERRKKLEEEAIRKKQLEKRKAEEEAMKNNNLNLNVACANSVAAILTSLPSEKERHELMAKIANVLYKA